jgi:hypothetical protein
MVAELAARGALVAVHYRAGRSACASSTPLDAACYNGKKQACEKGNPKGDESAIEPCSSPKMARTPPNRTY